LNHHLNEPDQKVILGRLMSLAAVFIVFYSAALTISPAVLLRSWSADLRWTHWLGTVVWLVLLFLAYRQSSRRLPNADPYILPIAMGLAAWGNLTVWRLDTYFGLRQSLWSVVAVGVLILGLRLPGNLSFLRRYKYVWLTGGLILTGLTIFLGTNPSGFGPRMWLGCCGIYFQPSEPLKVLLIIYLAAYLAGISDTTQQATQAGSQITRQSPLLPLVTPTIIMTGLATILLLVQRDLGTASIFIFLYAAILYITTGRRRVILVAFVGLLLAGLAGYALFDVVQLRIEAWLNPWLDPSGRSYQIVQSLLAIANGGVFGRGPGLGAPGVVPIAHSDFIYTALIEETGLAGALGLLLLLALFAYRGLNIALQAQDTFRRYLAAGLTTYLVAQAVLIIGGNIRLLPLTGVTLPFISYGGSSLLTAFVSVLFLLLISEHAEHETVLQPKQTHPYMQLAGFLFVSLATAALATGWWAFIRGPELLARTDNPRRSISDQYVLRGSILDRNNQPISSSSGIPGSYQRSIQYPELSPVIGYTHPAYGQAGLEASLDDYLRGLRGNPSLTRWVNQILYGQPPPGLDVRTTLDLDLQSAVDQSMQGSAGAAVLLNASTGEILAMASHPGFDANQLDDTWSELIQDDRAPLLNRATLGRYPVGELASALFPEGVDAFGLEQLVQPYLPGGDPLMASEQELSPLQAALIAAAISAQGIRPAPVIVSAVNTPASGWVLLPGEGQPLQVIQPSEAETRVRSLSSDNGNIWEYVAVVSQEDRPPVTWYVAGTTTGWSGTPLALVLVLEDSDLQTAARIGRGILEAAIS
jgi:cell division protein FtsW (lipid II flippase)